MELQEIDDQEVATILTRAARVQAGLPLEDKEVKEPKPQQPKTQADWEKEERLRKEFIAFIEEIYRENQLARQAEEALQKANTADLETNAPDGPVLDDDWVRLPTSIIYRRYQRNHWR